MKPYNLAATLVRFSHGFHVFEVDTKKATFHGLKWRDLGGFGKKKFENLVYLESTKKPMKILYT